ncbi:hypothetical protein BH18GEM1_BH18GEM1_18390 [soil metagenome]
MPPVPIDIGLDREEEIGDTLDLVDDHGVTAQVGDEIGGTGLGGGEDGGLVQRDQTRFVVGFDKRA